MMDILTEKSPAKAKLARAAVDINYLSIVGLERSTNVPNRRTPTATPHSLVLDEP